MSYQSDTWNFLKSKGLSDLTTAAIMGNIHAESGFNPDIIEYGNSIGLGLCQWSFGRRDQLEAYGIDFQHQLNFLWSELSGEDLEITGADFQWIDQIDELSHTDFISGNGSLDDLTSAFCFSWERPAEEYAHLDVRQHWALTYYNEFTGSTPPSSEYDCKIIIPIEFGTMKKISYLTNEFTLIKSLGNVVQIQNNLNNRKYYIRKSYIKIV